VKQKKQKKQRHQLPRNWTAPQPAPKPGIIPLSILNSTLATPRPEPRVVQPPETQAEMIDRKLRARGFDMRDGNGNPDSLSRLPDDTPIMFWSYCPSCKRRHERELTAYELKEIVLTDADPWEHGGHKQSEFQIRKGKVSKEQAHATAQ